MIGQAVSHYKITEKLGEGGMGVVYKADDTKLDRSVALKFLAPHLLGDEEAKARFLREAKAAAALDHPNICTLYEIDEEDGRTFMAMAYLEGPTLEEKIRQGLLPLDDALDIAMQMAKGLEQAHGKNIYHRDIKPSNLVLLEKGPAERLVKIMDFGLAYLADYSKLTLKDTTLGTPAYMSPEQAQGIPCDHRTDIWSLGVVLYEMVVGEIPFQGEYQQAIVYSILNEDYEPVTAKRAGVPMELERIIGKCLAKDVEGRYRHTDELSVDLGNLRRELQSGQSRARSTPRATVSMPPPAETVPATPAEPMPTAAPKKAGPVVALAALAGLLLGALGMWTLADSDTGGEKAVRKYAFSYENLQPGAKISPDGTSIAYVAGTGSRAKLWVRDIDSWESRGIAGTEGARAPAWSPDGRFLAFWSSGVIKKVSVQGGGAVTLCEAAIGFGVLLSWAPDGESIAFSEGAPRRIYEVSAGGGTLRELIQPEESEQSVGFIAPSFLPSGSDGRGLLFALVGGGRREIVLADLDTGMREVLTRGVLPVYSTTGHIVYQRGSGAGPVTGERALWALPFSLSDRKVSGDPFLVSAGVVPGVSDTGALVYSAARRSSQTLVWRDRKGNQVGAIADLEGELRYPAISRDGRYVAIAVMGEDASHIWVHDTRHDTNSRLTFEQGSTNLRPVWSPRHDVAYSSQVDGVFQIQFRPVGGSGGIKNPPPDETTSFADDWSLDGRYILVARTAPGGLDIWYLKLSEDGTIEEKAPFLETPHSEVSPTISPDGRFVAYASNESGALEVYVQSFPDGAGKWLVSTNGGSQPRWSRDGKELFFVEGETLISVSISLRPTFSRARRTPLFSIPELADLGEAQRYDVSADGKRFLTLDTKDRERSEIRVVENWFEEFRGRQ